MDLRPLIHRLHKIPAHGRLWIGASVALIMFFVSHRAPPAIRFIHVWTSFCFTILTILWAIFLTTSASEVKVIAGKQDSSRPIIFIVVLFASVISLFAVVFIMRTLPNPKEPGYPFHVGFAILSVILSWVMIHTTYAIRYTHMYYN